MGELVDFGGISKEHKDFVIRHLGMPDGHDYGWIRELFQRAFSKDISGEAIAKIEASNPNKVMKAREDYMNGFVNHKMFQRTTLLDMLERVADMGFEEKPFGQMEVEKEEEDEETGETRVRKVKIALTRCDPKSVTTAVKLCMDMVHEYERDKRTRELASQQAQGNANGLEALAVVKTAAG